MGGSRYRVLDVCMNTFPTVAWQEDVFGRSGRVAEHLGMFIQLKPQSRRCFFPSLTIPSRLPSWKHVHRSHTHAGQSWIDDLIGGSDDICASPEPSLI